MVQIDTECTSARLYIPALPTNNTGACIALHTPRTLPLLKSMFLSQNPRWDANVRIACCPNSTAVYAVSTNDTTNGTANCEYIVCELSGYAEFKEAATCMGRSLIIEDHEGEAGIEADKKRGCEFNTRGSGIDPKQTSLGARKGVGMVSLVLSVVLGALVLS